MSLLLWNVCYISFPSQSTSTVYEIMTYKRIKNGCKFRLLETKLNKFVQWLALSKNLATGIDDIGGSASSLCVVQTNSVPDMFRRKCWKSNIFRLIYVALYVFVWHWKSFKLWNTKYNLNTLLSYLAYQTEEIRTYTWWCMVLKVNLYWPEITIYLQTPTGHTPKICRIKSLLGVD